MRHPKPNSRRLNQWTSQDAQLKGKMSRAPSGCPKKTKTNAHHDSCPSKGAPKNAPHSGPWTAPQKRPKMVARNDWREGNVPRPCQDRANGPDKEHKEQGEREGRHQLPKPQSQQKLLWEEEGRPGAPLDQNRGSGRSSGRGPDGRR
jgi:hypothetical protein